MCRHVFHSHLPALVSFSSTSAVCQRRQTPPGLLLAGRHTVHHDAVPASRQREGDTERPRRPRHRLCLVSEQRHHRVHVAGRDAAYLEHGGRPVHPRGQRPRVQRAALLHLPAHEQQPDCGESHFKQVLPNTLIF